LFLIAHLKTRRKGYDEVGEYVDGLLHFPHRSPKPETRNPKEAGQYASKTKEKKNTGDAIPQRPIRPS